MQLQIRNQPAREARFDRSWRPSPKSSMYQGHFTCYLLSIGETRFIEDLSLQASFKVFTVWKETANEDVLRT
ncbi:hypothetical protein M8C21_014775 [Ambrosia artemisiifolia]|uniref:Uncharacterized protein n=1 Tax=Ambrosia artemisiifolia TaxID=4212 RepID=A0AAD5BZY9_AMBAR|nr:hypothetical protein M8C21_014775 [Ambrosia artemisiifolia]